MIITIRSQITNEDRMQLFHLLHQIVGTHKPITTVTIDGREVVVLDEKGIDALSIHQLSRQNAVEELLHVAPPYQLVSRTFRAERKGIVVGGIHGTLPVTIGGSDRQPPIIAGPCAVENREILLFTAQKVRAAGAQLLRGGVFKPRTSPYQFQGLGVEGLQMLVEAREETGLPIVTEVMEPDMVEVVAQHVDVLQIGSRNMQNYPLLKAAGYNSYKRPVLLKRGLSATIEEWLLAAEYIVATGNSNVILCERGIRSFDAQTRNLLDLTCVPLIQQLTYLPIIVDPSHATGRRELIPTMSRASVAAGADGLIIEVHPDPQNALCDGHQSITPEQLARIVHETSDMSRLFSHKSDSANLALSSFSGVYSERRLSCECPAD